MVIIVCEVGRAHNRATYNLGSIDLFYFIFEKNIQGHLWPGQKEAEELS